MWFYDQLAPDQIVFTKSCLAGAMDDNCYRCVCPATQAMVDHIAKVTPLSRFAINMGENVTDLHAGKICRAAGDQLLDDNSAVCQRSAVNADATKISGRVRRC